MVQTLNRPLRILRIKRVTDRTGKSRSQVYVEMSKGIFPSCIHISSRSVGWIESEIDNHIQECINQSRSNVEVVKEVA